MTAIIYLNKKPFYCFSTKKEMFVDTGTIIEIYNLSVLVLYKILKNNILYLDCELTPDSVYPEKWNIVFNSEYIKKPGEGHPAKR